MDANATQNADLKTEAIAGITTFFTMSYIVVVNPQIISADGKTGMAFSGVLTATGAHLLYDDVADGPLCEVALCGRTRDGHQRIFYLCDHPG
jgi:xanthine/uracil/vitamin C permease (AzgA family)